MTNSGLTAWQLRTLALLAGSVCFYTTKFFFSPIYIIYPIFLSLATILFLGRRRVVFSADIIVILIIALLTIIHGAIAGIKQEDGAVNGANANLILGIFVYLIVRIHCPSFSVIDIKKISQWMIWPSIIAIIFSTVFRYFNSGEVDMETAEVYRSIGSEFYAYKISDPLFLDSNTTASIALMMLSVILFLKIKNIVLPYTFFAVSLLIVGLISTYSRASMIAGLIVVFVYLWHKFRRYFMGSALAALGFIAIALFVSGATFGYISEDMSFLQKLDTMSMIEDLFNEHTQISDIVFGYGPGNSATILGIFTHNLFITYLVELGVAGLILFLIFIIYAIKEVPIVVLPTAITALSYYMYLGAPFFFLPIALGLALNHAIKEEINI